jgi:hypothetical protein
MLKEEERKLLRDLNKSIEDAIVVELLLQGHKATGTLINSIHSVIYDRSDLIQIDGYMIGYGKYVDRGRKAGSYVPISALMKWIKDKRLESNLKRIKSFAFAIQRKIFNVGISTPNSWRGTSTKDFLTKTLKNIKPKVDIEMNKIVGDMVDFQFVNMIREVQLSSKQKGLAA